MFLDHHFGFLLLKYFPSFVCRESMIEDIINERPLIKHHHHRYGSKVNRFKTMVVLVGWALQWYQDTNILQYWTWTIQLYTRRRHRLSMRGFSTIFKPLCLQCFGSIKNSLLSLFYIFPSPPPLVDEKWAAHDCTVMKMYTGTGVYRPVHFGSLQ